jgi:hypothetical protein
MPRLQLSPGVELEYRVDDYTDPWGKAGAVLMIHVAAAGAAFGARGAARQLVPRRRHRSGRVCASDPGIHPAARRVGDS